MVKTRGPSDYDRLEQLVEELARKHELRLSVSGWTRKTFEVFDSDRKRTPGTELLARIESFATTNGEIRVYDDRAMPFAEELGAALEKEFEIGEATLLRLPRPE